MSVSRFVLHAEDVTITDPADAVARLGERLTWHLGDVELLELSSGTAPWDARRQALLEKDKANNRIPAPVGDPATMARWASDTTTPGDWLAVTNGATRPLSLEEKHDTIATYHAEASARSHGWDMGQQEFKDIPAAQAYLDTLPAKYAAQYHANDAVVTIAPLNPMAEYTGIVGSTVPQGAPHTYRMELGFMGGMNQETIDHEYAHVLDLENDGLGVHGAGFRSAFETVLAGEMPGLGKAFQYALDHLKAGPIAQSLAEAAPHTAMIYRDGVLACICDLPVSGPVKLSSGTAAWDARRVPVGDVRVAVTDYTGTGYLAINGSLRGDRPSTPAIEGEVRALDSSMRPLPATTLYRGIAMAEFTGTVGGEIDPQSVVGQTFRDPGFASTTPDRNTAEQFTGQGSGMMAISVPAGTPGFPVDDGFAGSTPSESETLLGRGTTIMIDGFSLEPGYGGQVPVFTAHVVR